MVSGHWQPTDAAQHITFKELKIVKLAIECLAASLQSKRVALFSDSATTVHILNNLYTKSTRL
jgi:hypothetical protein